MSRTKRNIYPLDAIEYLKSDLQFHQILFHLQNQSKSQLKYTSRKIEGVIRSKNITVKAV